MFLLLFPLLLRAQNTSDELTIGTVFRIESEILQAERSFFVRPPSSETVDDGYPVLYLLDAESNFRFAAGMIDFLERRGIIPPMLLVGVPNESGQREVDLIPARDADRFLRFMKEELIPYVDSSYHTAPFRIISGHSSGAIFGTYALFEAPEVFNAAIASSAVFDHQGTNLFQNAEAQFDRFKDWNNLLYLTVGSLETPGFFIEQNDRMAAFLSKNAPAGLTWKYDKIEDGDHNFVALPNLYQGLLWLYADWRIRLSYQIDFDVQPLRDWQEKMQARFGYEMRIPASILIQRAMMVFFDQRYDEALPIFQLAAEQHPENADVHFWLARGYDGSGKVQEAISAIEKAIELAKNSGRNTSQMEQFLKQLQERD